MLVSVRVNDEVPTRKLPCTQRLFAMVLVAVPLTASVPANVRLVDHWGALPDEVRMALAVPMASLDRVVVALA